MTNLEVLLKDPYIKSFIKDNNLSESFVSSHINLFSGVYESRLKCINCKDLDLCLQKSKGERLSLACEKIVMQEIEYCPYMKDSLFASSLSNKYVYTDIPDSYANVNLNKIELLDDGQKQLCARLLAVLNKKSNKGLYIYGYLGVGKTYEAIALSNNLVLKGYKVAFVKVSNFINEVRKLVASDSDLFDSYMNKLKKVDYLFLDDIGSESVSSFSRDDVLFNILDYRMENKLTTFFTSNLSKEDLKEHYTFDKKDNGNLMMAERLLERIDILADDFVLVGDNKRKAL